MANWISSEHTNGFLSYYGIEKSDAGEYSLIPISHQKYASQTKLAVEYEDGTNDETLDVTINDKDTISAVYGGKDKKRLSSVFDLRMAGIVKATLKSEHKVTDF